MQICRIAVERDDHKRRTCRALVQTCKTTYGPALDALWYESRNFLGLANYFPRGVAATAGSEVSLIC